MKIRGTFGILMLLTALICCGGRDNQVQVYETMQEAAEKGDFADVKRHLKRGADVNAKDKYGQTPLLEAARNGHKAVAELLIAKGADVNAKDKAGWPPLYWACVNGSKDVVELLIAKGAIVNSKAGIPGQTGGGETPLHVAASHGHKDVVELLIAKGADVNAKTRESRTATTDWLFGPANEDDEAAFSTPLQWAARYGHKAVAELLIAKGADVNARNEKGATPLHTAARYGHKAVAELLIAKGADVNAKTEKGETPLFLALQLGPGDPLDDFMKRKGYLPKDEFALNEDRPGMVELLKKHGARE